MFTRSSQGARCVHERRCSLRGESHRLKNKQYMFWEECLANACLLKGLFHWFAYSQCALDRYRLDSTVAYVPPVETIKTNIWRTMCGTLWGIKLLLFFPTNISTITNQSDHYYHHQTCPTSRVLVESHTNLIEFMFAVSYGTLGSLQDEAQLHRVLAARLYSHDAREPQHVHVVQVFCQISDPEHSAIEKLRASTRSLPSFMHAIEI